MRLLLAALLLAASSAGWSYDYPINDPYLATVMGTPPPLQADLPDKARLTVKRLPATEAWEMPESMWYAHRLEYSFRLQRGPAPMIFMIAGTGGFHNTGKNLPLLKALFQAGFHVVGISSPTHSQFVIAASETGVPGHMRNDAQDLYRVMQDVANRIGNKDRITGYSMVGYSLGATNAAFVAELDSRERVFDFDRVLMINPPVSLYSSISKLDRMLQNIPGGLDNFNRFFEEVVQAITAAYKQTSTVEFSPDLVFQAFQENPPTREELAALVGIAFRLSSSALMFASDLRTDFGFIKPSNVRLTRNSSLGAFGQVAVRVGFTDYYHEYFWPFFEDDYPDESRDSFADLHSLHAIRPFLENAEQIGVFHNRDDVILARGEIDFFPEVFGDRARIFPNGGHLGNMEHRDVIAAIVRFFQ